MTAAEAAATLIDLAEKERRADWHRSLLAAAKALIDAEECAPLRQMLIQRMNVAAARQMEPSS